MNANLDPVTFEVLRHRFSSIAEEGALVLRNVSGSPSVADSNDCNVALLTATGEGVAIGPNIVSHALSCIHTVRYVLKEYSDNPRGSKTATCSSPITLTSARPIRPAWSW